MIPPEEIAKKESKSGEEEWKALKICLLLKRINAITGIFIPLNTSQILEFKWLFINLYSNLDFETYLIEKSPDTMREATIPITMIGA